jgi:hypothetical protein
VCVREDKIIIKKKLVQWLKRNMWEKWRGFQYRESISMFIPFHYFVLLQKINKLLFRSI